MTTQQTAKKNIYLIGREVILSKNRLSMGQLSSVASWELRVKKRENKSIDGKEKHNPFFFV